MQHCADLPTPIRRKGCHLAGTCENRDHHAETVGSYGSVRELRGVLSVGGGRMINHIDIDLSLTVEFPKYSPAVVLEVHHRAVRGGVKQWLPLVIASERWALQRLPQVAPAASQQKL